MMKKLAKKNENGFTLLEMIVSLALFSIIMIGAVGILILAQNAQLKTANLQNVQDNIRFVLEYMTKELRTGEKFSLCTGPGGTNTKVVFINDIGSRVAYQWDPSTQSIQRYEFPVNVPTCLNTVSGATSGGSITTDEVLVQRMVFQPRATIGMTQGPADGQPRMVMSVRVRSAIDKSGTATTMDLQATITARVRDDKP